jgi:hypothetical protein
MNRQISKENSQKGTGTPASPVSVASDSENGGNFSSYADYTSRDVSEEIEDEDPPLSERVAVHQDEVNMIYINFINIIIIALDFLHFATGKIQESFVQQRES